MGEAASRFRLQNSGSFDEQRQLSTARLIQLQIEKRAGLQLNTQVQINDGFYRPPPQPGSASPDAPAFAGEILSVYTTSLGDGSVIPP